MTNTTPAETVHACPPGGSGLTPCCQRPPTELPRGDRMTENPDAVTCTTTTPAEPGRRALRIRVLRETLHRLTTPDSGDSPTEDLPAETVRRVLAEMLADMTPSPDTDTPATPAPVDPALVERVARALLTVQLHIGPNAIATAQSGRPIRLSGGEADRGAAAVLAELAPELAHAHRAEQAETALTRVRDVVDKPLPLAHLEHRDEPSDEERGWAAAMAVVEAALTGPAEENQP